MLTFKLIRVDIYFPSIANLCAVFGVALQNKDI